MREKKTDIEKRRAIIYIYAIERYTIRSTPPIWTGRWNGACTDVTSSGLHVSLSNLSVTKKNVYVCLCVIFIYFYLFFFPVFFFLLSFSWLRGLHFFFTRA